jgi:hypothetical protein
MNDNFPNYYRTTREALTDPNVFWDAVYEEPEFREEIKKLNKEPLPCTRLSQKKCCPIYLF